MNERSPTFENWRQSDREVIEYPEGHHTLEFDPDPSRYALDLVGWLDRHFQKTGIRMAEPWNRPNANCAS